MRQRIHNLIGDQDTGYINTFHGFCVSVLQEDSNAVQYPKSFLVLDNSDIDSMLRTIYEERKLTLRDKTFSDARDMIEMQKLFRKPEYYQDLIGQSLDALHEKYLNAKGTDDIIFYGYLYQQKKCFGLDYNDLIKFTLYIFRNNREICLKWQKRLEYIMIDEFQDIDGLQYELMEVLCDYHRNLFIVGDPDQTIYTWRGANVKYLLDFDRRFPDVRTIMMVRNYRSSPEIISAANSLISRNRHRIPKDLIANNPSERKTRFFWARNTDKEAGWIADQIRELKEEKGVPYRDMTVLYRAHYVSRAIEETLLKEKIPYHIYSGVPFFGRAEVKDALSYLRMVVLQDDLSFRRIANNPKRNLGQRRMAFLEETAQKDGCSLYDALKRNMDHELIKGTKALRFVRLIESYTYTYGDWPVSELLSKLMDESGYEAMLRTEGAQDRLDNLAELKQSIYEYEATCGEEATAAHYLAHVALFTNSDTPDTSDQVKLMTIHAAKGLEFPFVFLAGMNEGIFPSRRTKDLQGMEEERRLAFVAMTRAEKELALTAAEGRNHDGSPRYPSRFVLDIDRELLEYSAKPAEGLIRDAREYIAYQESYLPEDLEKMLLPEGTRVKHEYLGLGTIESVDLDRNAYVIRFDELRTPRVVAFKAKLQEVNS